MLFRSYLLNYQFNVSKKELPHQHVSLLFLQKVDISAISINNNCDCDLLNIILNSNIIEYHV